MYKVVSLNRIYPTSTMIRQECNSNAGHLALLAFLLILNVQFLTGVNASDTNSTVLFAINSTRSLDTSSIPPTTRPLPPILNIFKQINKIQSSAEILKSFSNLTTSTQHSTTIVSSTTSTTSTTTTTTTTSIVTTTTTTTKKISIAYINYFNITEISYDNKLKTLKLGYLLKANFSSNQNDNSTSPILLEIRINCTSDSDQFWFKSIREQSVITSLTYSTTRMLPYNIQEPLPGTLINCSANTIDLNQYKTFHSFKHLLTNPLPVLSLEADSLNETSIELKWAAPLNTSFNIIDLKCHTLDDKLIFEIRIHSNQTRNYIVNNLTPGTDYICNLALVKEVNPNLVAKSKVISINQMTKLSQASLIENSDANNFVEFKLRPPDGNYDYFKFLLVDSSQNQTVKTQTYANKLHLSKKLDQSLIQFESETQPGYAYDLWTETGINTSMNTAVFIKRVKLTPQPIIIRPVRVSNIIIYALGEDSIDVTWREPSNGRFNKFLIGVYLEKNLIKSLETIKNSITIGNLTKLNYYEISIRTCTKLITDCDAESPSVNQTFNFQSRKIKNFSVKNYNTDQFLSTSSASVSLTWNLNLSESERCDLSRFHIYFTDFNKASTNDCFTKHLKLISSICTSYAFASDLPFRECDLFDKLNCYLINNQINCSFHMSGFNFNTDYNISISAVSRTGRYEWPLHNSATIHTDLSIPASLKSFQLLSNTQMSSNNMINIIQPYIDESNGPISESYLFLVLLGPADDRADNSTWNKSYSLDLIDQAHLNNLLERPICSNLTDLFEPCLLKKYTSNENDYRQEKPVFIGGSDSINSINLTGIAYENITSDLILPHSYFQLFYVFKIKNNNQRNNNLLFAINPSEPIKTHQFIPMMNQTFRDGMALWIVIVISITSSLLLLTIITALVTLIILKYKPKSRFRKAAQKVAQPLNHASRSNMKSNIESSSKTTFNDYNGMFMNEFVEPGEFSRYDMTNIWLVKHANGDLILDEEYRNLPDYRNIKTSYASQMPKNEIKNRFLDIKAYDDSRVLLDVNTYGNGNNHFLTKQKSSSSDTHSQSSVDKSIISSMSTSTSSNTSNDLDLSSDYINANFIQGYSHENKFIATQGPKKETINDFWLMIWQYRVSAIVMLTKLVEKGVERCTQYWPDKLNISESYGEFEITMKDQQKCGDYIKRTFELVYLGKSNTTNLTMTPGSTINKRALMVTQYYYPEWPDKDTPSTDPMSILHLIRDINLNHLKYQYPIVVHCSAGVGRTGTYITLDAMMEKINTENKIDIYGFISKIRERRQYLVQTSKQYVFIHEALYEYCLYGFTDVEASRLVAHYKYLNELSPTNAMGIAYQNSTKTRLQIEFEKINNAFVPNSQAREAFSSDNKHRNRYLNTICYDENRIKLSGLNGSTYINATKVKGYEPNNEIIITQDPMFNTVFEFWKMITEYECNVIVSLNKDFEYETESLYWPTQEETLKTFECEDSRFVVQLLKLDDSNSQFVTKRELEITEYKYGTTTKTTVTHFLFNEIWPEDRAPKNKSLFLDLIGQVQKTAARRERPQIAVHAHGGGSNCSVFVALIYLLDQFKNDQYVDVCRLVKKMKVQRPHMVETFEQYEFLYQCLVDFADMFGIYSQSSGSFHSRNSLTDSLYRKSPAKQSSTTDVTKLNHVQLNL